MREIGGYIELDNYNGKFYHENGIKLNSGKSCLAYLLQKKNIKLIYMPYYLCDSIFETCKEYNVDIKFYNVGYDFCPIITEDIDASQYIYIVNYYGQLDSTYIKTLNRVFPNIILDNVQSFYSLPLDGISTIYSCRKFFGVPDGAVLYTDVKYDDSIVQDISYKRFNYLIGRYELGASSFYKEYVSNNAYIRQAPVRKMSKLTYNLLKAIDYDFIKDRRTNNYCYLHRHLNRYNKLALNIPVGAFAYPFYCKDGKKLRNYLIKNKVYVPLLWPNILETTCNQIEYDLAQNILPIPCDQRYSAEDMYYIIELIKKEDIL